MMLKDFKVTFIQELLKRNFYLSNLYENRKVARSDAKTNKILVYQMGKVASTSLYKTLKKLQLDASIYHLHVLQPSSIDRVMQSYKRRFLHTPRIDEHIIHSQYLRRALNKGFETLNPKWKIITLVRDPIARNISEFFQRLPHESGFVSIEDEKNIDLSVQSLIQNYFQIYNNKPHPFNWLDLELRAVFDIDIPLCDFPKANGFKIYTYDHVDVLLIKLEKLNECVNEALVEFLNLKRDKEINLVKANESSQKKQGELYTRFKKLIEFSPEYLDKMYKQKQLEEIYSEVEIEHFYRRWRVMKSI